MGMCFAIATIPMLLGTVAFTSINKSNAANSSSQQFKNALGIPANSPKRPE
ncbi:MAG: hypothetical protein ACFB2X_14940 [Rivularia sp. (in: cyanobacteria)]